MKVIKAAAVQGVQFATFPETVVPYYPYFSAVQTPLQDLAGTGHPKLLDQSVTVPSPAIVAPNGMLPGDPIHSGEAEVIADLDFTLIDRRKQLMDPRGHDNQPELLSLLIDRTLALRRRDLPAQRRFIRQSRLCRRGHPLLSAPPRTGTRLSAICGCRSEARDPNGYQGAHRHARRGSQCHHPRRRWPVLRSQVLRQANPPSGAECRPRPAAASAEGLRRRSHGSDESGLTRQRSAGCRRREPQRTGCSHQQ
jgi:hypothetical protein